MISKAIIIPTGDELKSGVVLDTDSPMIMQVLLSMNGSCNITRNEPLIDSENIIIDCIKNYVSQKVDLIILIGGSGGGHRYSSTLGKDFTHSSLDLILEDKYFSELYGKNGHMWSKLICGTIDNTLVINVPGPFQEAKAAIEAFKKAYEQNCIDLKQINLYMTQAVKSEYGNKIVINN
ncbi:molybdopterin biosynthesis enzyme [Sedimentibacter acidaminivorans]|uniref:Molybdopterin biosynthesis enzyme n=1 Tax=Sedimentibacter acidaminivorans TaxID=913099 RepID=A0ABS4GFG9_9FIRM|nr:molybdopterin biosynthesis enzyme [Sedimentibacter acidaminivorans]